MKVLSQDKKHMCIAALVEGNSIRSIERMTGVHRDTICRLLVRVGEGCAVMMDARLRDLDCDNLQIDEIWTYVGKKQGHLTDEEKRNASIGDQWVFVAMDADSKLVPAWSVGKRTQTTAIHLLKDLKARVPYRPQISTDGFVIYEMTIPFVFGAQVDWATQVKHYYGTDAGSGRYAPPRMCATSTTVCCGDPALEGISTSYIERQNLTMRMHMRRFTRLTNAFSKKTRNLRAAVALHFAWYNFVRVHQWKPVSRLRCGRSAICLTANCLTSLRDRD